MKKNRNIFFNQVLTGIRRVCVALFFSKDYLKYKRLKDFIAS